MKTSELLRLLIRDGWYVKRAGKGSHKILMHKTKTGEIVFPDHGAKEIGKGLERMIKKQAGLV